MDWVAVIAAVLAVVFGLGYSLAPRRGKTKVVAPPPDDLLEAHKALSDRRASEEYQRSEEAAKDPHDPHSAITDLFR